LVARGTSEALIHTLHREQLADSFQFSPTFRGSLGIGHFQSMECIKDNLGHNQPGVPLIIGGDDIPWRVMGAGRVQVRLIRLDVMLPVFSFVNVGKADFPVLLRLIDALEEALS
jgi:hypothetical protein